MSNVKFMDGSFVGKRYKPDLEFRFRLAVPCVDVDNFAMLIEHDGQNDANVNTLLKLADEGKAPYCVSIGVWPGNLLLPDGSQRNMRMNSYDLFDREYGDFLVYELIPHIEKTYGIHFSKDPDMHFVSGGSSGGISAFVIAWFHPDYFRRVYMASPSFLAMGRGNEIPHLIRKCETKPIRVYEEFSENEPNDYFGGSWEVAEAARKALVFAKYDFHCEYFPGEGHCSRRTDEDEAYKRNQWIWRGWKESPVTATGNSPRVEKVIPFGSKWEYCEQLPDVMGKIPEILAETYDSVVLSNDEKVWYAGQKQDDLIYMYVNEENILPEKRILHGTLHTIPRQKIKGAIDMAVDRTDRLFVLTEMGIQCVRSYGLIDVILDLPDDTVPEKIAITDALYVQTEKGVYRRELCADCVTVSEVKRKQTSYYD